MQNRISVALAIIVSLLLSTCSNDKDPGPDLSGNISFTWTLQYPDPDRYDYFVLISDSSGNVLGWKNLPNGEKVDLPYPPSGQTANVSIIYHVKRNDNSTIELITTFTGIPGGNYSYTEPTFPGLVPDGTHEIVIEDSPQYALYNILVSTDMGFLSDEIDGNIYKRTIGLYDDRTDNLLITLKKHNKPWRYHYKKGVTIGETTTISEEFYDTLKTIDPLVISFASHKDMDYTFGYVIGHTDVSSYFITSETWNPNQVPLLPFIDIPGMFNKYETLLVGVGQNMDYVTDIISDEPVTELKELQVDVTPIELSTKKLAADINGDGDIMIITGSWEADQAGVRWSIYAPVKSKFKLNLPQFPDDLVQKLPGLSKSKDQKFSELSVADYNMTYEAFALDNLNPGNFDPRPYSVAKEYFNLDAVNARVQNPDAQAIFQRHKRISEIPWMRKN